MDFAQPFTEGGQFTKQWLIINIPYLATDTSTEISFTIGANTGNNDPLLDGVTFEAVPEPTTLVLLGLGLGGVCLYGARRGKRRHSKAKPNKQPILRAAKRSALTNHRCGSLTNR